MAFRGESYAKALNSVLMASGLQGKLDGRTLLVGTSVSSKTFGPQMSKVFRLNQVDATSALNYLGKLGTKVNVANTKTVTATSVRMMRQGRIRGWQRAQGEHIRNFRVHELWSPMALRWAPWLAWLEQLIRALTLSFLLVIRS